MAQHYDVIVIGGGLVGSAIAYGFSGTHANLVAPMIVAGGLDPALDLLTAKRLDVPPAI